MQEPVLERQDAAVGGRAHAHVVDLPALVVRAEEVLAAVLDPLHRHAEPPRGPRDQHLLGVELDDLDAEAAADVGRDYVDAVGIHAEEHRQPEPHARRRLGGVVHQEAVLPLVVARDHAARLDRHRGASLHAERPVVDVGGGRESGIDVAGLLGYEAGQVVRHVEVREGCVRTGRPVEVDGGRERVVLDDDALERVLGDVAVAGDDHRKHLARVAGFVLRQGMLGARRDQLVARHEQGARRSLRRGRRR